MSAMLLSLKDISLSFPVTHGMFAAPRTLYALRHIDLDVRKGETLGLVGESGCGKSTLAKVLLGILTPQHGDVTIDGRKLAELSRSERARRIQPVFQDPYSSLNPVHRIGAIVGQPLKLYEPDADRPRRVAEMLERVGLPSRLIDALPSELSGGQRQRVAIARALILKPSVLICDEPTSALDVSVQAQVLNLLNALKNEMNLTMLFISHNLAVVDHIADRVAIMYLGEIVEQGDTATIMRDPRHPYTKALMTAVLPPRPGQGIPAPRLGAASADPFAVASGCAFQPRCPDAVERCSSEAPMLKTACGREIRCHLV